MDTLKERTAKSMFWSVLNNGTIQVLNIVIGIFLARLLTPADYGLMGVLAIFTLIAGNLQSSGFTLGLVNMKAPTPNDYNSVFWFNIIVSFIVYGILWFCAPLIAQFFRQPALVHLSRFVFLAFLISSFGIAQAAYMNKNMMNREIAIINIIALSVSSIVGVTLAFMRKAYWSLAWQQVIYISVLNVGRYYYTGWRPSMHIDFGPVKRMFGFSVKILFTSIINTLSSNMLTFVFGRLFPIKQVGTFTQAYKWNTTASTFVSNTLWQVVQTVLVATEDDRERQKRVFRKMMRFTAFLSFPVMFGLTMVSREFILLSIGNQWIESIRILQILCIAGAFVPFYSMYQNVAISSGRSDIYLWCNVLQILLQLAVILLFRPLGFTAMIIAFSALTILWLAVWQYVAWKLLRVTLMETLLDVMPFFLISSVVMAVTYFITNWETHDIALLLSRVVLAVFFYVGVMKLAKVKIMNECLDFLFKRKHKEQPLD